MKMDNLTVDVSDGVGFFQGLVSDISRFGMCLTDLPKRLNGAARKMTVVVSWKGEHFKMDVRPRWFTEDGAGKYVGVEITNAPWSWTEFVMKFEPAIEKDVWDTIHL